MQTNLRILRDDLLDGGSEANALTRARDLARGEPTYTAFEAELADWTAVRGQFLGEHVKVRNRVQRHAE